MEDELLDGFARAVVTISFDHGTRVLHPHPNGDVGPGFPFEQPVHIVTAYNPGGVVSDAASNAARHRSLVDAVAALGVETLETIGSGPDGSIPEPGLLMAGLVRETAIAVGRRFGQSAIYEWRNDGLEVLGVDTPSSRVLGWRLAEDRSSAAQ
ncbi:MAG: DUF3293 domain-containing protein [Acidimicrobiia bacterium]|nr:DUF3293 domain-containing protein [Acidimicrobiia bacterium]MDH3470512.1 DUF3293 domain-containing protein [Acidimicrobiia bacterium]